MAKTVIVADDTVREWIEAYASLAAWFYQLSDALRLHGVGCEPPSEEQRRAYVAQLALTYPELAAVATALTEPRPYVPPPVLMVPVSAVENEGREVLMVPVSAVENEGREVLPSSEPIVHAGPLPPPMVMPGAVRY